MNQPSYRLRPKAFSPRRPSEPFANSRAVAARRAIRTGTADLRRKFVEPAFAEILGFENQKMLEQCANPVRPAFSQLTLHEQSAKPRQPDQNGRCETPHRGRWAA